METCNTVRPAEFPGTVNISRIIHRKMYSL